MPRSLTASLLLMMSLSATAQPPADSQRMLQGMQAMQDCMARIDLAAMQRLGEEGRQVEAEVKALCAAGQRDAAQTQAITFGMKIAQDSSMKTLAECGKQMQGMLPPMNQTPYADLGEGGTDRHVCDNP
ncbi:MAG: hypothetical protein ABR553_06330 [Gammaproteobacteria bacterium]